MWVDGVGGFLTLLGERIIVGQPSAEGAVDLPIRADLSRRHCIIRREQEGYVLEPVQALCGREIRVDAQPIEGPTRLADGNVIDLGQGVKIKFSQPHALSATARLDIVSHHKTQPTTDAVLLMSDTCILGPNPHCHVPCKAWQRDVVLYRRYDDLICRTQGPLEIDSQATDGPATIGRNARIEGEDFAIRLESL